MDGHEAPPGYTVSRRLGSDASAMFLATEDDTGRPVTLRSLGNVPDAVRERLVAAVPTLRAVDHPHVIPFLDVVTGPSGPVVVLGPAEGGSLAGILGARGVLPAGEVVTACAPIADGLTEVHRRGLVHGDLSLDDIVFTLDGKPMVVGVGLVQVGVQLRVGQYARPVPPEVAAGSPPGPPADIYGLAAAAMITLSGHLPSAEVSLPGVAPGAEALLTAGLNPDPHRRPDAATLGNAFFAVADPTPVELVLEEGQATTGSLPQVSPAPLEPDDDVAAYMSRSTSIGRRARRRAEGAGAGAASSSEPEQPAQDADAETSHAGDAGDNSGKAAGGSRRRRRAAANDGEEAASAPAESQSSGRNGRRGRRSGERDQSGAAVDVGRRGRRSQQNDDADPAADESSGWPDRKDGIRIVSAIVGVLVLAGAVIVGMQVFGDDEPQSGTPGTGASPSDTEASTDLCGGPQPAPTTAPPEVSDWTNEVQRLYSQRSEAFEEGNPELLCQVHAPSNPVLAEDVALLEEYSDAGVHTDGLTFEVVNAELVEQDGGRATVRITQRIPDYTLVNDDGEVEQEIQGTEDETWEAELVAVPNDDEISWRFG